MGESITEEDLRYGDAPTIQAAWRLGAELQFWSTHERRWKARARPHMSPSLRSFYRVKPKE